MFATQLIGKKVIRTGPTRRGDYSYTNTPLLIIKATGGHIVCRYPEGTFDRRILGDQLKVLNSTWLDDKWVDYDQLMGISKDYPARTLALLQKARWAS